MGIYFSQQESLQIFQVVSKNSRKSIEKDDELSTKTDQAYWCLYIKYQIHHIESWAGVSFIHFDVKRIHQIF